MGDDLVTCANCGKTKNRFEYDEYQPNTVPDEEEHDWSDADPFSRLKASISAMSDAGVLETSDTEEWQWVEIALEHDVVTASEIAGDKAQTEGFGFVGIDNDGSNVTVRFNRKK